MYVCINAWYVYIHIYINIYIYKHESTIKKNMYIHLAFITRETLTMKLHNGFNICRLQLVVNKQGKLEA